MLRSCSIPHLLTLIRIHLQYKQFHMPSHAHPLPCLCHRSFSAAPFFRLISSSAIPWFEAEGRDMPLLPSPPYSPDQISSASWLFPLCRPFPTEGDNETPDHPSPYLCGSVAPLRQNVGPGDMNPHRMINLLLLPSCAIPHGRFFILRSIFRASKGPFFPSISPFIATPYAIPLW